MFVRLVGSCTMYICRYYEVYFISKSILIFMIKGKHRECRKIFAKVKSICVTKQFEANRCKNIFSYISIDILSSTKTKKICKSRKHRTSWYIAAYTVKISITKLKISWYTSIYRRIFNSFKI